jgi:response regulator of citrate/malate metabolism
VAATISVLTEMGKQLREIQTLHQEVIDHLVGSQQSATKGERARKGKRRKGWLFPDDA